MEYMDRDTQKYEKDIKWFIYNAANVKVIWNILIKHQTFPSLISLLGKYRHDIHLKMDILLPLFTNQGTVQVLPPPHPKEEYQLYYCYVRGCFRHFFRGVTLYYFFDELFKCSEITLALPSVIMSSIRKYRQSLSPSWG